MASSASLNHSTLAHADPCNVNMPVAETCCVSPCDPPWSPGAQCMFWYETRSLHVPFGRGSDPKLFSVPAGVIEFGITYEHKLCLLGKQHGPLLYTQTLLPGEKVTLYHSDRYRRITSEMDRYSVQTTFMQFLSVVHPAIASGTLGDMKKRVSSVNGTSSVAIGGGLGGLLSGGASTQTVVTDQNQVNVGLVSDLFSQSVIQSSQLTQAERSVVVSSYEEKDLTNVTSRTIQNDNECRAVTYFIRKVVELYGLSTGVSAISYRIIAPNVSSDLHSIDDLSWLQDTTRDELKLVLKYLPKIGEVVNKETPISLPTDGTIYDPELAHCCSCEPERTAAISIRLEKLKAEAQKSHLEAQILQIELERRKLRLQQGELGAFEGLASPQPSPNL